MIKYILVVWLFWTCSIASAQIMLPAYQGVFNKKALVITASNGLDFDGVNDYAVNTSLVITPSLGFTIEGWMKIRDLGYSALATQTINYLPAPFDIYVENGSGRLTFLVGQSNVSGSASGSTVLAIGTWTHVAFVYNPAIAKVIIYVNGVQDGIGDASPPGNVAGSKFIIGNRYDLYTGLNGTLDDVRIWNVARTPSQILANMNNELLGTETGLKAYYTFNQGIAAGSNTAITTVNDQTINAYNATLTNFAKTGATSNFVVGKVQSAFVTTGLVLNLDAGNTASYPGTGTTWTDLSGNGYNGTLTNGPTYSSSNGGNIVFDGTNDVASFGNILNIGLSSWTMSCWVKFNSVSGLAGIIGKTSYRGYVGRYSINLEGGNLLAFFQPDINYIITTPVAPYLDNKFHNLVMTINRTSMAYFYVDGISVGTPLNVSSTSNINLNTSTDNFYIGSYGNGDGQSPLYFLNGNVSQASIYNRALTAAEVLQNYNTLRPRF